MYEQKPSLLRRIILGLLALVVLAVLIWLVLWLIFWRNDDSQTTSSTSKPKTTQQENTGTTGNNETTTNNSTDTATTNLTTSSTTSRPSTLGSVAEELSTPTELADTGPGALWVPVGAAVIGGTLYAHIRSRAVLKVSKLQ